MEEAIDLDDLFDLGPINEHGYAEGMTAEQARFLAETLRAQAPDRAAEFDAIALRIEGRLN